MVIPKGVLKRLSHLTSQDDKGVTGNKQINELYLDHWNVLLDATLVKKSDKPLRMKILWKRDIKEKNNKKPNNKNSTYHKHSTRNVYFVHGYSKLWLNLKEPIHKIKKHLQFQRIRISYIL